MLNPTKAKVVHQWKHGSPLIACRFDPQGRFAVSSAEDYSLQRWEILSGELTTWPAHESWIKSLAFLPDGNTLFSGGCDDQIAQWDLTSATKNPVRSWHAHDGWVRALAVSPDGQRLVSAGNDNLVKIWDAAAGTLLHTLSGHESHVYSVAVIEDGASIVSGDLFGKVIRWDAASGETLQTFDAKALHTLNKGQGVSYGGVRGVALSPDGQRLACVGLHKASNPLGAINEPIVLLFDRQTAKLERSLVTEGVRGIGWGVAWLADGSLVALSGGRDGGFLLFWKPDQEKTYHKLKLPKTARDMHLSRDGNSIVTAHADGQLRISSLTGE